MSHKLQRVVLFFLLIVASLAMAREPASRTHQRGRHVSVRHKSRHSIHRRSKRRTHRRRSASHTRRHRRARPEARAVRRRRRRIHSRSSSTTSSAALSELGQNLVQNRSPAAYRAVERYAATHPHERTGALAWLTLGYCRLQDEQYAQAIAALEKARGRVGPLEDYAIYFEAEAYAGEGDNQRVADLLEGFDRKMASSVFRSEAVEAYGSALYALGRTQETIDYLQARRRPLDPEIELILGESYLRSEHPGRGMSILKHIYFTMPLSPEAADAEARLTVAGSALVGSYGDMRTRADLLAAAGRWDDAADAYSALLPTAPASERGGIQVALASVLRHTKPKQAQALLEQAQATGAANARRLYLLGEMARDQDDAGALDANLDLMRQQAPRSRWLDRALRSAANFYLLRNDLEHSRALFAEEQQRFPASARAGYANWKAAWFAYRLGHLDEAVQGFEKEVRLYPYSPQVAGALYWRARIAEDRHEYGVARAWYEKLSRRFHNYYYGFLGRDRLAALPPVARNVSLTGATDPILASIPDADPPQGKQLDLDPPPGNAHAAKSRLLESAGLDDFAVRELQAVRGSGAAGWATFAIASLYEKNNESFRALQYLKRAVPGYYALSIPSLPRPYWELLFPRPYWSDLSRQAAANGLNPYLVAALIRQESEFNPGAVSHANAYGLMQLLPRVGRREARRARIRHFHASSLLTPQMNLRLGTRYFKEMVSQYNGQVEYALAAYNAGTDRVNSWLQNGSYRDIPEFVESIPFTETRGYVQAIVRNAEVYRELYSKRETRH